MAPNPHTLKPDCIFCQIVSGQSLSHTIWQDDKHVAFLSIFPNTAGFTVVTTKDHLGSYAFDQSDEVLSGLIIASKKVAKILDHYFEDVARCGLFFEGFGVDHLHSKLFPMHGTAPLDQWKPLESRGVDTYFEQYPGYLSSHNSHRASDEVLADLAKKIRASYS